MKKFLLSFFALLTLITAKAQINVPYCETFDPSPTGWTLSQGAKFGGYPNPDNNCTVENGIITPGVGGNNPANVLTPAIATSQLNGITSFSIWPFDANLTCASRAANFLCATSCDIYLVKGTYNSTGIPHGTDSITQYTGFVLTSGGTYELNTTLPSNTTLPATYKILLRFGSLNNCNQPGIKYVLDNFCFQNSACQVVNCPPTASIDQFVGGAGVLRGFLWGNNLNFSNPAVAAAYNNPSLPTGAPMPDGLTNQAVNDGTDSDPNAVSTRTGWTWTKTSNGTAGTYGTINVYADGTFDFTRNSTPLAVPTNVYFEYTLSDGVNVTAPPTRVYIALPKSASLPVKFLSFSAQQVNGKVALKWQTAQELNNKEFQVQRKMANGGYQAIATVSSKALFGNSGTVLDYSFDDLASLVGAGQVYYRIKQIDLDGRSDFSEIRSIRNNAKKFNITIYPNPGRDLVKVTIPDGAGIVDISLSDMSGKEIKRWNSTSVKNIELTNLRPGMYTIRINVKETGDVLVDKIMIQ